MPKTEQFYYFTSTKYALDDIKKRRLKAAELDKTNDPYELLGFRLDNLINDEKELLDNFKTIVSDNIKTVCLSKTYKNPSLWGHYAEKCKGVCLGFDIDVYGNPEKDIIAEVKYGDDRKYLDYFGYYIVDGELRPPTKGYSANNILYYKSIRWQHEEEWRIGAYEKNLELDPTTGLYFYPFSNGLKLREILIGFRCEEENIKRRLEKLTAEYPDPKPEIIFTRPSSSTFEIEMDRERQK